MVKKINDNADSLAVNSIPSEGVKKTSGRKQDYVNEFPIVGIGASAGGLAAFETFFSSMPADNELDLAFVIVQHLSADHKSALTEIIQRYTNMEVFEVGDGMDVRPNCIYIIPPNKDMALLDGTLHLFKPAEPYSQRLPIDFFFRSLAQDLHERAICIVLSGTGSDGSQGVRAVKGEGGIVIAQSPETTEHNGMQRNAIATGAVDYVIPVTKMPEQLLDYATHVFGKGRRTQSAPTPKVDNALKKIFIILRSQTGNDFSQYKTSTIYRRIERRLAINQIEQIEDYVRFLQQSKAEAEALYYDLLIGVTQFFRDTDAFKALQEVGIPKLFANKPEGSALRVWVPCCSTGEEAYSIAILIFEYMEAHGLNRAVQIFATDIDSRAIAVARAGIYPAGTASDNSPERLKRFFTADLQGSAYRINKNIRDMMIFSEQNIVKDPPFSKLGLISCRNFLIYLNKELQNKIIGLFHYSLNPGGILFLGNSENLSESALFAVLDHNARLFQSKKNNLDFHKLSSHVFFPVNTKLSQPAGTEKLIHGKRPVREIAEQALLNREDMAGIVTNSRGDIIYLHGRSGLYLELSPGEAEMNNILKMAREGLKHELTTALRRAADKKEIVRRSGLKVRTNGQFTHVNISVHPLSQEDTKDYEVSLFLVVLEKASQPAYPDTVSELSDGQEDDIRIEALKQELRTKEDYLQAANEELETANEELSSSNEEMQSINEELQSTNEELETSREELQSINEELTTVNAELQAKVSELTKLNNDMNNMLSGTGVGTIFLDHQLRIMRFTPAATEIINLIDSDVGRPVAHLVSNLFGYDSLVEDLKKVLHTLAHKKVEVMTQEGRWYMMGIRPYRTLDNVIEGAVLTFVDITELKAMTTLRDALAGSELRFRRLFETAQDGLLTLDADTGEITGVNQFLISLLGYSEEQFIMKKIWDIGFFRDFIANKQKFEELQGKEYVRYSDLPLETADGRRIDVEFISSVYKLNDNKVIQCAIRERKKAEGEP